MHIGERIKDRRRKRGWTQEALAEHSGVPQPMISRLESGDRDNPTTHVLRNLACALGCSMDYLAGIYDEEDTATRARPRKPAPVG
jgi:transcriptional regulator with XRE-family HTH domain